jgi:hypothetical protein
MGTRLMARGLAALGTLALAGAFAGVTFAQPAPVPVRVVQGSDGTLFVIQGSSSWMLVPDQVSDSDIATLNLGGEIDGTFPKDMFVVQAPPAPPEAAPSPPAAPAAAPQPAPAAPPAAAPANITDLTGKAANAPPGTPIQLGQTVMSVVDADTKPSDVYAVALTAGVTYQITFTSPNKYGAGTLQPLILNPNRSQAAIGGVNEAQGCYGWQGAPIPCQFTPAASGTYSIKVNSYGGTGQRYTVTITQT